MGASASVHPVGPEALVVTGSKCTCTCASMAGWVLLPFWVPQPEAGADGTVVSARGPDEVEPEKVPTFPEESLPCTLKYQVLPAVKWVASRKKACVVKLGTPLS